MKKTASLNTYAKLTPPQMFVPEEEVRFRLQYSSDLVFLYATLVIEGYREADYPDGGRDFTGTKITKRIMYGIAGQGYDEFIVPGGTLGFTPEEEGLITLTGKMTAKVIFGNELENGHVADPVFTSNETYVNMLVMWDFDFKFLSTPYSASGSVFTIDTMYNARNSIGEYSATDAQSYRYFLYDENYRLVHDSGELYQWDSVIYGNNRYTFRKLRDGKTYYVRAKLTLNGGYTLYRGYEPITVSYEDIPQPTDKVTLENVTGGIKITADLSDTEHTKVTVSRSVLNTAEFLELASVDSTADSFVFTDSYAVPETSYIYKISVYNGDTAADELSGIVKCVSGAVTISDIEGSYSAVGNITKHPINRNDRGSVLEAMDAKFPYHIINGSPDYDSGTVDGLFAPVEECEIVTDNADYADALRAWLNNGRAKLLTYYTGEAWIVAVSGVSTTDPDNCDVYNTSFNWTQIGDADDLSDYSRLGLVTT